MAFADYILDSIDRAQYSYIVKVMARGDIKRRLFACAEHVLGSVGVKIKNGMSKR